MLFNFNKKKQDRIANAIAKADKHPNYWAIVRKQFYKNRLAVWALRVFYLILFVAIFGDFIANERPLYCQIDGETYYPVFREYLVDMGLASWDEKFVAKKWLEQDYETVLFPPITYSPYTQDRGNSKFKSPFDEQTFENNPYGGWHYLGTERLGLDIASGLIHGTRTAMLVGLVTMSIATLIGLFLGAISGYFGDERLKVSRGRIMTNTIALFLCFFYAFITNGYVLGDLIAEGHLLQALGLIGGIYLVGGILANLLVIPLLKIPFLSQKMTLPIDIFVMRLIEIFNSVPLLVLILAILSIIERPSILFVMVILGLVSWTGIAKFVRAELLRIRKLQYIEAAEAFGYSEFRIILRHALPNALAPVLIAIAFGVASAILIEAYLSFLGVGVPDDQITWGSLLNLANDKISAWWLAVFPGFTIFITVIVLNLIGEGLTEALDPKMRE